MRARSFLSLFKGLRGVIGVWLKPRARSSFPHGLALLLVLMLMLDCEGSFREIYDEGANQGASQLDDAEGSGEEGPEGNESSSFCWTVLSEPRRDGGRQFLLFAKPVWVNPGYYTSLEKQ